MNELFGVSMNYIAATCAALALAILAFVALIAVRNPVMFKLGLRNIPRRPAQTTLIVVGLMLSTLIITAAFSTGDTLSRSITAEVYAVLGEADEVIEYDAAASPAAPSEQSIPLAVVDTWIQRFENDPDIEAFVPFIAENLPVLNSATNLNEPAANIVAFRTADAAALGGLRDTRGNVVTLSGNQIAVNRDLARETGAKVGDKLLALYEGRGVELEVVAIVPSEVLSGAFDTASPQGGAVDFAFLSDLTGRQDAAEGVFVSNTGDVREGVKRTDAAMEKLEALLAGTPYKVDDFKRQGLQGAELLGNVFTTFFIVLGLFSIAAGIMLIFLIFVMLAAERKPEMGMARAVGAKRRQLVESFLAEGMGYDLGSAVVGLIGGLGVTYLMIAIITSTFGEEFGLNLAVSVTPRSLVTAFSLGLIATFIVIFFASVRASRLNIVSAIRDLPETSAPNDEARSFTGYVRGAMNGFVAFGILLTSALLALRFTELLPLFGLAIAVALAGPWIYFLRGSNFALPRAERKKGERISLWPIFVGIPVPPILIGYLIALAVTAVTRERARRSFPAPLLLLGAIIAPLGLILATMQPRSRQIPWSVGFGTVCGVMGAIMIPWGRDAASQFLFAGGVSLVFLWAAVTLRYFHIAERLSFTVTSALLLAFWYLAPAGRLEWLTGELEGDIEMFFLSGLVMVTAGTFIVVYNADIILPLVAALGARFGRIVPALKTGVAYPLTSRFRTGMTMAMIGLIMFALVVNATLNENFSNVFLNQDSKGGWDVQAVVNSNNRIEDLPGLLQGLDVSAAGVRAVGENRFALPTEAEVENIDQVETSGEIKPFLRYLVIGGSEEFFSAHAVPLKLRAAGYETDSQVWEALASGKPFAVLPAAVTAPAGGFGPPTGGLDFVRFEPLQESFQPFDVVLRDPATGLGRKVTVIGQQKESGDVFWPGILVPRQIFDETFPSAEAQTVYIALNPDVDSREFARTLESALLQASVRSLDQVLDEQQSLQTTFLLVFQGFMGLGLIVGIAALGVVASRSVVERRQQIGMLRAIGYKRSMVALSFLFESGFIALSGILLGVALGLSLAWVLFTSGGIGPESANAPFSVPWSLLGIVCGIAFVASMLMTFLPARSASRVAVAEALRYE